MEYQGNSGWVYAAREDGTPLVKIGYTRYPQVTERIKGLHHEFHVMFTLVGAVWISHGVRQMERAIHRSLAASRIEKEWFYLPMNQGRFQEMVDTLLPDVLQCLSREEMRQEEARARWETDRRFAARCFTKSQALFKAWQARARHSGPG